MKRFLKPLAISIVGLSILGTGKALADLEISGSVQINAQADFYAPLGAEGVWVDVGEYGRCWRPAHVAVDWRPYCDGTWVWTDCGWYWESDEPWAWACYHYGRWVYYPHDGWIWIPGVEWAPAWVSWRVGGGYVGWAPLAPAGAHFAVGIGVASPFVFVEMNHFDRRVRPSTVIVNNTTIINRTKVVESSRRETRSFNGGVKQKVIINEGPGMAAVQKATSRPVKTVDIHEVVRHTRVPEAVVRHNSESFTPKPHEEHNAPRREESHETLVHREPPARENHERPVEVTPEPRHDAPLVPTPTPVLPKDGPLPGRGHGHSHDHGRD